MASSNSEISNMIASPVSAIILYAKKEISKHPPTHIGGLKFWISKKFPFVNGAEMRSVFQQLEDDCYLFLFGEIYPPNMCNENERAIMKFVLKNDLPEIDHGILHELHKLNKCKLNNLSRILINQGWHDNERETQTSIRKLCKENIIIVEKGILTLNWELIGSELNENNSD